MTIDATWLETEAAERVRAASGDVILDLSTLCRLDAQAVRAIEQLAQVAESRPVRVVLRNVQPDVYRVLKLLKLTGRFSFRNGFGHPAPQRIE